MSPEAGGESYRAMSTSDGRVYEVAPSQGQVISALRTAVETHKPVQLTLEDDRVVSVADLTTEAARAYNDVMDGQPGPAPFEQTIPQTLDDDSFVMPEGLEQLDYRVTNLSTVAEAKNLYNILPQLNHKSQCYQRAHYWARLLWSSRSVNSMKVFLFFTRRFIRSFRYKWWFHVAPMVYGEGQEVVLDPEFLKKGELMADWTAFFVMDPRWVRPGTRIECQKIDRYSQYTGNQEAAYCYTLRVPMYYYQPIDVENLDKKGTRVDYWRDWDVKHSQKANGRGGWWPF